jgi:hypothetical protein
MIPVYALIVSILGVSLTAIGVTVAILNYQRGGRQEPGPAVKATINRKHYLGGWRSVQLHMVGSGEKQQDFEFENWRIERARLLNPSDAILARAENDDYARGVFYPENPVRELIGKSDARPQPFALEFFIKFEGEDRGRTAKFSVTFSKLNSSRRRTSTVSAVVPSDAESAPVSA